MWHLIESTLCHCFFSVLFKADKDPQERQSGNDGWKAKPSSQAGNSGNLEK